jgi:Tfp pilus assembly protein PilO
MKNLQEVFNQLQTIKGEQRTLRSAYREALAASAELTEASEQIKNLREKKIKIEQTIKEQFSSELDKLDQLKIDLEAQNTMLADIALSQLMSGQTVEVVDLNNNVYEPIFNVRFKKTNTLAAADGERVKEKSKKGEQNNLGLIPEINHAFD